MILIDSSIWIDYFNAKWTVQTRLLDSWLGRKRIVTGDLVLAEVLQGFSSKRAFALAHGIMTSLGVVSIAGEAIAVQAATHYHRLRTLGITPRKTIDTLIATRCIADRIPLLYSDRDFDPFVAHCDLISAMAQPV